MLRQIGALALLAGLSGSAIAETPGVDQILASYREKAGRIETISVILSGTTKALVSPEELFRDFRVIPADGTQLSLTYHRDGRFRQETLNLSSVIFNGVVNKIMEEKPSLREDYDGIFATPYEDVRRLTESVRAGRPKPVLQSIVFDGTKLWKYDSDSLIVNRGVEQRIFNVVDPDRFSGGMLYRTLLEDVLLTFDLPGLPKESAVRRGDLLPDLVGGGAFRVADRPEEVEGNQCVVLESANQRISLDPALGFAVRKRLWLHDGAVATEFVARDFERLADHLWFPRSAWETLFASKSQAGGRFAGKPYVRTEMTVSRVELNRPEHLSSLSVTVPAGSLVMDETIAPVDEQGRAVAARDEPDVIPTVNYVTPADRADLDRVIQEARVSEGRRALDAPIKGNIVGMVLAFNAGLLAILLVGYAYRSRRAAAGGNRGGDVAS